MMSDFFTTMSELVIVALTAITVENIVFSQGLSVSRLMSLVDDSSGANIFTLLLAIVSSVSSIIYYYLNRALLLGNDNSILLSPLLAVASIMPIYLLLLFLFKFVPSGLFKKALESLPIASFNIAVINSLVIPASERMSLVTTVVYAVGSAVGFALAVALVVEGQRLVQHRDIPTPFKGKPAMLLYLSGLAMAVYALAGRIFTIF